MTKRPSGADYKLDILVVRHNKAKSRQLLFSSSFASVKLPCQFETIGKALRFLDHFLNLRMLGVTRRLAEFYFSKRLFQRKDKTAFGPEL